MKKLLLILLITLTTHTFSFAEDAQESDLTLGFLPYLSSQVLLKKYQPLVDYLSKELGRNVKIKIAKDYDAHLKATGKDELDISFLGGSPYVVVTDRYGKKPLLARYEFHDRPHFRSVFYTASNSDIKSLKDLKGKNVVFGSKRSTLSTQVPYFLLMKAGLTKKDIKMQFVDNQENVVLGVLMGEYHAGSASEEVYRENEKMGLRAIEYSPYLSTHVFVTRSNMDKKTVEKIKIALFNLKDKPEGERVLKGISPSLTAFTEVRDSDYNLLRSILNKVLPELE